MSRSRIRVLVVEDSVTVRRRLVEILGSSPDIEIVGEAADGRRGIELCHDLRPDVATIDMVLPVMSGLAATEYIMAYCPTPIVIVSSSFNRGDLFKTYDALAAGAVDALEKPNGDEIDETWERRLLAAVKVASRIKVVTHPRARLAPAPPAPELRAARQAPGLTACAPDEPAPARVAIGASTGGPGALVEILRRLPLGFRLPILIVMHIGRAFGAGFAEWLDGQTPLSVTHAIDGEPLPAPGRGRVVLAPPDYHLVVSRGRLRLTLDPERHSCRPSIDVLFESLARECGRDTFACLLTGMGRDGAQGLLELRRAGAMTLAQDESTSTVFGMPRQAILLGAAREVLPLGQIARAIAGLAACGEPSRGSP